MSVTSANVNDLAAFINAHAGSAPALGETFSTVAKKFESVWNGSGGFEHVEGGGHRPDCPSLKALGALLGTWNANAGFVNSVRNDLIAADRIDAFGNASVSDEAIRQSLVGAGLDKAPGIVTVDEIQWYGEAPYSGFRNDPISMATGNFLLREGDVRIFGTGSVLTVVRAYNALDPSGGCFGRGWTSLVEVALRVADAEVTFRGPDGGGVVFRQGDDGGWHGGRPRNLALDQRDDGWEVRQGHDRAYRFDPDGELVGLRNGAADVVAVRTADEVRFTERTTGRWVAYELDPSRGRAVGVATSDGQRARYDYDGAGQLVAVHRPSGRNTYEYDAGLLATVTDADGVLVCRNTYDVHGRVITQLDRRGRETYYEYRPDGVAIDTASDGAATNAMVHDRRGRMTAMIDGLGHALRLTYDDDDRLVQVVDRSRHVTRYEYDERGNVVRQVDPDGAVLTTTWDALDRVLSLTDRAGSTTSLDYDGRRRAPVRVGFEDGTSVVLSYEAEGALPVEVTDADGVVVRLSWTADGLLESVADGIGGTIAFEYDGAGRTVAAIGQDGRRVEAELDRAGRIAAFLTADGRATFDHSPGGRLLGGTSVTDARWSTTLDAGADVRSLGDDLGLLAEVERDQIGRITAMGGPTGWRARFGYDPLGRVVTIEDGSGQETGLTFDADGRIRSITDAAGRTRSWEYDELGRPITEIFPSGATAHRTYHPGGQIASTTDADGRTWSNRLDPMGRASQLVDPAGNAATLSYTPGGRLAAVRTAGGRSVTFRYDAAGQVVGIDGPAVGAQLERDVNGAVVEATVDGRSTRFSYDPMGRLASFDGPLGGFALDREFGEVIARRDVGRAPAVFERDARGRLAAATDPAGVTTAFERDGSGRTTRRSTGTSTRTSTWDRAGRLTAIADAYGRQVVLGYDAAGGLERVRRADGTELVFRPDVDGLLRSVDDGDGATLLAVERSPGGAATSARTTEGELTLRRDAAGRPVEVGTAAGTVRYGLDPDGFVLAFGDDGRQTRVVWDDADRPRAFEGGGTRVEIPADPVVERDAARRVTTDEDGRRYAYDEAGRLAQAIVGDATTTFGYDALGLLASERTPAGDRTYHYGLAGELVRQVFEDRREVAFEYDANGRRVTEASSDGGRVTYEWGPLGRLAAVVRTDADGVRSTQAIEHDPIGRPQRVAGVPILWDTAVTGRVFGIGDQRYAWWGGQVAELAEAGSGWGRRLADDAWGDDGGTGVRLGYRGELALDGLLFLGARVYDTRSRTFLSPDPLLPRPGELAQASPYGYAANDPVNLVDPSGGKPLSDEEFAASQKSQFLKYVAKAAVVVAAVAITVATAGAGAPVLIAVGVAVGAASAAALTAIDGGSLKDIARAAIIGGLVGGLGAGLGAGISSMASQSASTLTSASLATRTVTNLGVETGIATVDATTQELLESYLPGGDGRFDLDEVLSVDTLVSGAAGAVGAEVDYQRNMHSLNTIDAEGLDRIDEIGDVLKERIVDARPPGGFSSPEELLDIPQIGPVRTHNIKEAVFTSDVGDAVSETVEDLWQVLSDGGSQDR